MPNCRETTTWTIKGMFNRKLLNTETIGRQQWWSPAISKAQGISKSTFVQTKTMTGSVRGRAVTQLEEPFSEDSMMDIGSKTSRELMIE